MGRPLLIDGEKGQQDSTRAFRQGYVAHLLPRYRAFDVFAVLGGEAWWLGFLCFGGGLRESGEHKDSKRRGFFECLLRRRAHQRIQVRRDAAIHHVDLAVFCDVYAVCPDHTWISKELLELAAWGQQGKPAACFNVCDVVA